MLGKMARNLKDGALSLSMKTFVNDRFRQFGEVVDCAVDTEANTVALTVQLKGEHEPIQARIDQYALENEGEDRYIVLQRFSSSREWIGLLMTQYLAGKRYKLPGPVSKLL
jgi:hypothetical protein